METNVYFSDIQIYIILQNIIIHYTIREKSIKKTDCLIVFPKLVLQVSRILLFYIHDQNNTLN